MSLLLAALIGLLAATVSMNPGGKLWRKLVEGPAFWLNGLTWRRFLVIAIVVAITACAAELAIADMAWILAADIVTWIDVFAATLIITRLLPGWRALKTGASQVCRAVVRARPRAQRSRRTRRPTAPPDDADPAVCIAGGLVFA